MSAHQWTRTKVSSSPLLLFRKSCHIFANLHNPLWRALALKTTEPIVKFHTILSDPVSDFWKCPKKGFKKKLFMAFFSSEFCHQTCATITQHHTLERERERVWSSAVPRYEDDFESRLHYERTADCKCLKLAIDDGGQTVLYCTVLWSTVPSQLFLREGSFEEKKTPIFGPLSQQGGGV